MEDKWVVQNNSGKILILPINKLRFTINGRMDLVERLGLNVREIEINKEVKREIAYNNLVTIEKHDSISEHEKELAGKMDKMMSLLESGISPQAPSVQKVEIVKQIESQADAESLSAVLDKYFKDRGMDTGEAKKKIEEEEKMREDAIKQLIDHDKKPDSTLKGFGDKKEVKEEPEDFSDLIDFE